MVIYEAPWKLRNFAGRLGNGWMLSGIGQFHSGLPYTMRVTGSLPEEFDSAWQWRSSGLRPGMNGSGGDNRSTDLAAMATTTTSAATPSAIPPRGRPICGSASDSIWAKCASWRFMAESFNLFNHQNVTEIETTGYTIEPGSPQHSARRHVPR